MPVFSFKVVDGVKYAVPIEPRWSWLPEPEKKPLYSLDIETDNFFLEPEEPENEE